MYTQPDDKHNEIEILRIKLTAVEKELALAKTQIKLLEWRIQHGCPLKTENTE